MGRNKPIDIFITAYLRPDYTQKTIEYLRERTNYPYRLFLIDNGGNEMHKDKVDHYIRLEGNFGIHAAWNVALSLAESEYFITSDNDIYVPDLIYTSFMSDDQIAKLSATEMMMMREAGAPTDWLSRLVGFMDERPDYAAISLHPHVLIGAVGFDPNDPEDVKEVNMCGAVMRIMRTEVIRKVGGWDHRIEPGRNHEERTICSRLRDNGWKVGRTTRVRIYHPFGRETGGNWGYPEEFTPEMQKHNPALKEYVLSFDNKDAYDEKTWLPK